VISCLLTNFGFTLFLALGWGVSEWLGQNEKIKANSVYQISKNILKVLLEKK
jgi:hypothetical protein